MSPRSRIIACLLALPLTLAACQTLAASQPATVDLSDPRTRSAVRAVLAKAVGNARAELGASDGRTSVITVLPPPPGPYEDRSTAMPIRFDVMRQGGRCVAIRHDTGQAYDLRGVSCTAETD